MSCCQPTTYSAYAPHVGKLDAPKRNHYYFSKLMDVLQFEMEQAYSNDKRWLLNRLSIGTGVLCGLNVRAENNVLCVDPGVALDAFGHEIIVPGRYCLDPWLLPDACGKPKRELARDKAHQLTLCLGYHECLADHAPVMVTDCRAEQLCEAGTVVESFKLFLREGWPKPAPGLCEALSGAKAKAGYEVVATIDTSGRPLSVAVSADAQRVAVLNDAEKPMLQIVDAKSNAVVHALSGGFKSPLGTVSVAPEGGPAFASHADGLMRVDLSAAQPSLDVVLSDVSYGICVAAQGGKVVYAINTKKKVVDVIDVASKTVKQIKTGKRPSDLALSSDSKLLFVADTSDDSVYAVDTASGAVLWQKPTDKDTQALAATGAATAAKAWSAAHDVARRYDASGAFDDATFSAQTADAAFTSDGKRVYVIDTHKDSDDDIVVLNAADASEIARLPVGRAAAGVAIAPARARGYIANADSGTVTVIDVAGLRERLCRALLGPCPDGEKEPCVELATLELLPDGSIGKLDVCTHRTRLLSNETLLELILCLADQMEHCCGGQAPPPPPPPDKPPEVAVLKVTAVEFVRMNGDVLATMQSPNQVVKFKEANNVDRIRLTFNRAIDASTATTGGLNDDPAKSSVLVAASWSSRPLNAVLGEVKLIQPNVLEYHISPDPRQFTRGDYKLVLFGSASPSSSHPIIKATDGGVLDGEPNAFPSGDGVPGGDFIIQFVAQ